MLYLMNFGQNLYMKSSAGKSANLSVCAMIIDKLATVNSTNYLPLASSSEGEVSFIN